MNIAEELVLRHRNDLSLSDLEQGLVKNGMLNVVLLVSGAIRGPKYVCLQH